MSTEPDGGELVEARVAPDIRALLREYGRCAPAASGWNALQQAEAVRFARWAGQADDGRKWASKQPEGAEVFPWNGCSDARVRLADDVVTELMEFEELAFWRSVLRTEGVEASDAEAQGFASRLLEWVKGTKQTAQLAREVPRHSAYVLTYGWSVLYVSWEREFGLRWQTVGLEELTALDPQLAALVLDPTLEAEAVAALQRLYDAYVTARTTVGEGAPPIKLPKLRAARVREVVRELRTEGRARLPVPHVCRDEPSIVALRPWDEVCLPSYVTDIQRGPVFVRRFLSEVELRSLAEAEEWHPDWVERVVKTKGQVTVWGANPGLPGPGSARRNELTTTDTETDLIEVVYGFVRQLDEDGVPGVWVTVFSPAVSGADDRRGGAESEYGKHGLLDYAHGKMPFVVRCFEPDAERIQDSRGVPELVMTDQRIVKGQVDTLVDLNALAVLPPINSFDPDDADMVLRPGGVNPALSPGREPRFMEVPTKGAPWAFELIEFIERRVARRFGRVLKDEPPQAAQAKLQLAVMRNNLSWLEAFKLEFSLIGQFMAPERIQRITGGVIPADFENLHDSADLIVGFDVRELDTDYLSAKLGLIKDYLLAMDSGGIVERNKLTAYAARVIDPVMARMFVGDAQQASEKLFEEVKQTLTQLLAGFEPKLVENDPSAGAKLTYLQQLLQSNPVLRQAAMSDQRFAEQLQVYGKNLLQSVNQEMNKVVGRVGVTPGGRGPAAPGRNGNGSSAGLALGEEGV